MKQRYASWRRLHPWVTLTWLTCCICLSFANLHPVLSTLSLICALITLIFLDLPQRFGQYAFYSLGIIGICILFNACFVNLGQTPCITIGHHTFYLESLAWGYSFGALFSSIITWSRIASLMLSPQMLMGTIGRKLPMLALCIMMIMRSIHRLVYEGKDIHRYLRRFQPQLSPIKRALTAVHLLFGNMLEATLITSLSMRARGFGLHRMQHQGTQYLWSPADIWMLFGLAILASVSSICTWIALSQFSFYPVMPSLTCWLGYLPSLITYLAYLPFLLYDRLLQRKILS